MTEITRVPLAPIARGSLSKLWLGVFLAALGAAAVAGVGKPPLVDVKTLTPGTGPNPSADDWALVDVSGRLDNGTIFQPETRMPLQLNHVIPGFAKALEQMQAGGKYQVRIPAKLAYGDQGGGVIPPNSALNFTVQLMDFKTAAQVQAQEEMIEQMRRMRAEGAGGTGGGAPAPGADAGAQAGAGDPGAGGAAVPQ